MTNPKSDKELLEIYKSGFKDELYNNPETEYTDNLKLKAYRLGRIHAIVGDDVSSIDLLTNEELLSLIKS